MACCGPSAGYNSAKLLLEAERTQDDSDKDIPLSWLRQLSVHSSPTVEDLERGAHLAARLGDAELTRWLCTRILPTCRSAEAWLLLANALAIKNKTAEALCAYDDGLKTLPLGLGGPQPPTPMGGEQKEVKGGEQKQTKAAGRKEGKALPEESQAGKDEHKEGPDAAKGNENNTEDLKSEAQQAGSVVSEPQPTEIPETRLERAVSAVDVMPEPAEAAEAADAKALTDRTRSIMRQKLASGKVKTLMHIIQSNPRSRSRWVTEAFNMMRTADIDSEVKLQLISDYPKSASFGDLVWAVKQHQPVIFITHLMQFIPLIQAGEDHTYHELGDLAYQHKLWSHTISFYNQSGYDDFQTLSRLGYAFQKTGALLEAIHLYLNLITRSPQDLSTEEVIWATHAYATSLHQHLRFSVSRDSQWEEEKLFLIRAYQHVLVLQPGHRTSLENLHQVEYLTATPHRLEAEDPILIRPPR